MHIFLFLNFHKFCCRIWSIHQLYTEENLWDGLQHTSQILYTSNNTKMIINYYFNMGFIFPIIEHFGNINTYCLSRVMLLFILISAMIFYISVAQITEFFLYRSYNSYILKNRVVILLDYYIVHVHLSELNNKKGVQTITQIAVKIDLTCEPTTTSIWHLKATRALVI